MESRVNTEGITVHREVLKALKNYKQGALLEGASFSMQYRATKDMLANMPEGIADDLIRRECIKSISNALFKKYRENVEKEELENDCIYHLRALILPLKDFKHIVEYAIRTMPENALSEIRNNAGYSE